MKTNVTKTQTKIEVKSSKSKIIGFATAGVLTLGAGAYTAISHFNLFKTKDTETKIESAKVEEPSKNEIVQKPENKDQKKTEDFELVNTVKKETEPTKKLEITKSESKTKKVTAHNKSKKKDKKIAKNKKSKKHDKHLVKSKKHKDKKSYATKHKKHKKEVAKKNKKETKQHSKIVASK